jgi:type VI secretion system protein ImpA
MGALGINIIEKVFSGWDDNSVAPFTQDQLTQLLTDETGDNNPQLRHLVVIRQKAGELRDLCREKMGIEGAPDFQGLISFVDRIYPRRLSLQAEKLSSLTSDSEQFPLEPIIDTLSPNTSNTKPLTRQDAVTMLDTVCKFLEETEPANPAPLLIKRARDLIGKDFLAILQTLAPDGLAQARNIAGITP